MNTVQETNTVPLTQDQGVLQYSFYDRVYTSLFLLIPVLLSLIYFYVLPIFIKTVDISLDVKGDVLVVHVHRLSVLVPGFLIIEKDSDGVPNSILEASNYLYPGTYKNFDIQIVNDGSLDANYFANILTNGKLYLSFREGLGNDKSIDYKSNNKIAKDIFGRRIRLVLEKGVAQFY